MAIDLKQIKTLKKSVDKDFYKKSTNRAIDFLTRDLHLFDTRLSNKKKEAFYSELSILLNSGIDIRTSLEIIIEEQTQASMIELFENIYYQVIKGASLSEALFQSKKITLYEYYSLKIGEESGKIRQVLIELSHYFSKAIKQRRQLTSALTYPVMVIITAFVAVFFMLKFIVPMFTEVFNRFQGDLPPMTRFIISMSGSFSRYAIILVILLFSFILFAWTFRKLTWYRQYSTKLLLSIPILGKVINKIYLARFCQGMALLLGSKTPMLKTIQLVRNMIGFYPFEQALICIENDILHGKLLNQSMQQFGVFDRRMIALTRVAEEVNQLDKVYTKLNIQYSEELEHQIGIIGNLLEPAMIVVVGVMVAVILISMYLPLFQLSTSVM